MDKKVTAISVIAGLVLTGLLYLLIGAVNELLVTRIPEWVWVIYFSIMYLIVYHGLMQCQPNTVIIYQPRRRN